MFQLLLLLVAVNGTPAIAGIHPSVVYDNDDQIELHQVKNSVSYSAAQSTVALFESQYLQDSGDGTTRIIGPTYGEYSHLCPGEHFAEQPSGGFCSGVLVAPNVVLTAGHCVEDDFCKNTKFVLGYSLESPDRDPWKLETRQIFACDEILAQKHKEDGIDFALIRLKSIATSNPMPMNRESIAKDQDITMLGFPMGIPLKVVEGTKILRSDKITAKARLDAFGGSSGSPIIDAHTGHLLAILTSGENDFIWDRKNQCNRVKVCHGEQCKGELLLKISAIIDSLGER